MKIEPKTKDFQPVTLTMETPEELALITALIGVFTNNIVEKEYGVEADTMYRAYYALCAHSGDGDVCDPLKKYWRARHGCI